MTTTVCARWRAICPVSRLMNPTMSTAAVRPQSQPEVLIPMLHSRVLACIVCDTSSAHRMRVMLVPPTVETRSIGWIGAAMRAVAVATIDVTGYQAADLIRPVLRDRAVQVSASTVTWIPIINHVTSAACGWRDTWLTANPMVTRAPRVETTAVNSTRVMCDTARRTRPQQAMRIRAGSGRSIPPRRTAPTMATKPSPPPVPVIVAAATRCRG